MFRTDAGANYWTQGLAGTHSYPTASGIRPMLSMVGYPINQCIDDHAARDLALFQLDARIPMSQVYPLHVPLFKPACNQFLPMGGFPATLVGYGNDDDPPFEETVRRYRTTGGWEREGANGAALYQRWWSLLGSYTGMSEGGDSGGPLVNVAPYPYDDIENGHTLCGVDSGRVPGVVWHGVFPFVFPEPILWNNTAAVDSSEARAFLQNALVDAYGNFMGECNSGPEQLRDVDTDGDFIPDACDPCPNVPDLQYKLTGKYADWPDDDKDGVPDACDNCPTLQNGPKGDPEFYLTHHRQRDQDGDGLGDRCDFCNNSHVTGVSDVLCCTTNADCSRGSQYNNSCVPVAADGPGWDTCPVGGGVCSKSRDYDVDGVGDNCDNCPRDSQWNQNDTDGDGIGDVCDLCDGNHHGVLSGPQPVDKQVETCIFGSWYDSDDAQCVLKTGDLKSTCVGPRFAGDPGKCTWGADSDKDGLGDACDGCPNEKNVGFSDIYTLDGNCNLHTEIVRGIYPLKPNRCDPTPCPLARAGADPNSVPHLEHGLPIWEALAYDPITLPNQHPDAYKYYQPGGTLPAGSSPTATVGARFCPCKIMGVGTNDPMACHREDECPIDVTEYGGSGKWVIPEVVKTDESFKLPTPVYSHAPLAELHGLGLQNRTQLAAPELNSPTTYVAWHINPHGPEIIPKGPHGTVDGQAVYGVFWTHIPTVIGINNANTLAFLPLSSHYKAGFFGQPAIQYTKELNVPLLTCGAICFEICAGHCGWNELENLYLSRVNPADIRIIAQSKGRVIDLTDRITPPVLEAMSATDTVLVQPAEVGWNLPGSPLLAAVSRDGSTVSMVAVARQGKLTVLQGELDNLMAEDHGIAEVILPHATGASEAASIASAQTGFGLVLSATQRALFVVGGATAQGQWASAVRVYDIDARQWTTMPLGGPSPRNIIAATYRAADRSLYVFDQGKDGPHHVSRLVRIDLGTMRSRILGSWPRKNSFDRVFLSQSWDGNLLLASSSSQVQRHVVLGVDPSGNKPRVLWGLSGSGAIAADPTLTGRGLTIPVFEGESAVNRFLLNRDLPATRLDIGACL